MDVCAARQPGTMAVRMARASADMATTATVTIEIAGDRLLTPAFS